MPFLGYRGFQRQKKKIMGENYFTQEVRQF